MKKVFTLASCLAVIVLTLGTSGCQSTKSFYKGRQAAPEYIVPLAGTSTNAQWKSFDLEMSYSHEERGDSFQISGQVKLSDHYKITYERLEDLELYLLILDSDSLVIKAARLITHHPYYIEAVLPFKTSLSLPPGAVAFSFAYDGVVREAGVGGSSQNFMLRPK